MTTQPHGVMPVMHESKGKVSTLSSGATGMAEERAHLIWAEGLQSKPNGGSADRAYVGVDGGRHNLEIGWDRQWEAGRWHP